MATESWLHTQLEIPEFSEPIAILRWLPLPWRCPVPR